MKAKPQMQRHIAGAGAGAGQGSKAESQVNKQKRAQKIAVAADETINVI